MILRTKRELLEAFMTTIESKVFGCILPLVTIQRMKNCRAKLNSTGSFILKGLAAWPQLEQLSLEAKIEPTLDSQTEVTNAIRE